PPPPYGYPPPPYGYPPPPYGYPPPYPAQPAAPPRPQIPAVIYGWDEDVPPPTGYELDSDSNRKLVGTGIGLLAAGWMSAALVGGVAQSAEEIDRRDPDDVGPDAWTPLYFPVIGPFVGLGTLKPNTAGTALLLANGVVQAGGAISIVWGLIDRKHKVVLYDLEAATRADASERAAPAPRGGGAGTALVAGGGIVAGLGMMSIMASGIAWLAAAGNAARLDTECPDKVCVAGTRGADALEDARDLEKASGILFGVGAPLLAGGSVLMLMSSGFRGGPPIQATPVVGAGFLGGALEGRF
ncbi:MAG TPA: hypothetical protein VLS89_00905, partial [Candidatus Nanopelagicales bacterium]|nr:hypothetical protein [Candidatus Nanopelagicales bacterium]